MVLRMMWLAPRLVGVVDEKAQPARKALAMKSNEQFDMQRTVHLVELQDARTYALFYWYCQD